MKALIPHWPAPPGVRALSTTRETGVSTGVFSGLNLALHVEDNPNHVVQNRRLLRQFQHLPQEPIWLEQTHSTDVVELPLVPTTVARTDHSPQKNRGIAADGAWTRERNVLCVVLTGDCLPLLLCDAQGSLVAAIHCGWRGLLHGIIENTVQILQPHVQGELLAWLGPAIGPQAFEVGAEVRDAFVAKHPLAAHAFKSANKSFKWLADIFALATIRLHSLGITQVFSSDLCTYSDPTHFFSFRRDGQTGRMATLIWLADH
jgi:polyphenol oxidase